jgi:hypothetical protein
MVGYSCHLTLDIKSIAVDEGINDFQGAEMNDNKIFSESSKGRI